MNTATNNSLLLIIAFFFIAIGYVVYSYNDNSGMENRVYTNLGKYSPAIQFQGAINTNLNFARNGSSGNNLPIFKSKSAHKTKELQVTEVDFPSNETEKVDGQKVSNVNKQPTENTETNYATNENITVIGSTTYIHGVSIHQGAAQTYNTESRRTDNSVNLKNTTSDAVIPQSNSYHPNTTHSPFLSDNYNSMSTDIFDNGSSGNGNPSFVDENGTPGDPGVIPVGEGVWILLALVAFYTTMKFKIATIAQ